MTTTAGFAKKDFSQSKQEPTIASEQELHFRVSSALKRVIGRDLITDEFVAIFELVKNAFDARASRVDIVFDEGRLFIIDNGKGMSLEDIKQKWLFVAYSAKKDGTEEVSDYRDRIGARRAYAGSKGVGRFSCDRLGETLRMQTRVSKQGSVDVVAVDWDLFEQNAKEEFVSIPVQHETAVGFDVPVKSIRLKSGTILEIGGLREPWARDKLLKLRAALAKLINPFGGVGEEFDVNLIVPGEEEADTLVIQQVKSPDDSRALQTVNGPIHNFIFDTLKGKTTHLEVNVSDDGHFLESVLTDRGALIYRIREPNPYSLLAGSDFKCNLFFLNRSAKATFTQRMGVQPISFGSVFLFKNGFRIFPIGEEGEDTFGIDRRKQQGYARFLGTRDIIGRIDVGGSDENFRESTSRDQGLIDTPAYRQLVDCFDQRCFRRLERYVVGVNWRDALDLTADDTSRLRGDSASARITAIVTQLAGADGVELLEWNRELIRILNERSGEFVESLSSLRVLAEKSGDDSLLRDIEAASTRFAELQRAEAAAREAADRERVARREAERTAADSIQQLKVVSKSYEEELKRSLFLTSISSLDKETIEILHHQIIIHASAINEIVNGQFDGLRRDERPTKEALMSTLENISFQNRKVLSIARFATKANFRLDSERIEEDLPTYIQQYIEEVAPILAETGIRIRCDSVAKGLVRSFKPIEVSILIDNLVSNAGKAEATRIDFKLEQPSARELKITVNDDGLGFSPDVQDLRRLFEKGFSSSTGSGLGLYHVAQILEDLGGSITAERPHRGASFVIRIRG